MSNQNITDAGVPDAPTIDAGEIQDAGFYVAHPAGIDPPDWISDAELEAAVGVFSSSINLIPFIGGAKGLYEAISGEDLLTGKKKAGWERVLDATVAFTGAVGVAAKLAKTTKVVNVGMDSSKIVTAADNLIDSINALPQIEDLGHADNIAKVFLDHLKMAKVVDTGSDSRIIIDTSENIIDSINKYSHLEELGHAGYFAKRDGKIVLEISDDIIDSLSAFPHLGDLGHADNVAKVFVDQLEMAKVVDTGSNGRMIIDTSDDIIDSINKHSHLEDLGHSGYFAKRDGKIVLEISDDIIGMLNVFPNHLEKLKQLSNVAKGSADQFKMAKMVDIGSDSRIVIDASDDIIDALNTLPHPHLEDFGHAGNVAKLFVDQLEMAKVVDTVSDSRIIIDTSEDIIDSINKYSHLEELAHAGYFAKRDGKVFLEISDDITDMLYMLPHLEDLGYADSVAKVFLDQLKMAKVVDTGNDSRIIIDTSEDIIDSINKYSHLEELSHAGYFAKRDGKIVLEISDDIIDTLNAFPTYLEKLGHSVYVARGSVEYQKQSIPAFLNMVIKLGDLGVDGAQAFKEYVEFVEKYGGVEDVSDTGNYTETSMDSTESVEFDLEPDIPLQSLEVNKSQQAKGDAEAGICEIEESNKSQIDIEIIMPEDDELGADGEGNTCEAEDSDANQVERNDVIEPEHDELSADGDGKTCETEDSGSSQVEEIDIIEPEHDELGTDGEGNTSELEDSETSEVAEDDVVEPEHDELDTNGEGNTSELEDSETSEVTEEDDVVEPEHDELGTDEEGNTCEIEDDVIEPEDDELAADGSEDVCSIDDDIDVNEAAAAAPPPTI